MAAKVAEVVREDTMPLLEELIGGVRDHIARMRELLPDERNLDKVANACAILGEMAIAQQALVGGRENGGEAAASTGPDQHDNSAHANLVRLKFGAAG